MLCWVLRARSPSCERGSSTSILDNVQAFPIDLQCWAESHKEKVQASGRGGHFMDEIIATVTRLEVYRPCSWLESVRLPQRTEWRRGEARHTPDYSEAHREMGCRTDRPACRLHKPKAF